MLKKIHWAGLAITVFTLSACNGGGGSSSGPRGTTEEIDTTHVDISCSTHGGTDDLSSYCVTAFDEAEAERISQTNEFVAQDLVVPSSWSGAGYDISSNAYADINLQYARSVGLTGAGQTIAIVDGGFLLSHDDLANKNISVYGPNQADDHGTFVATIAAGDEGNGGVMGVASGADLHLTGLESGSSLVSDVAHMAQATLDAANAGAIVQNNSWGYVFFNDATITLSHYLNEAASNPGLAPEDILGVVSSSSSSDWVDYISALEQFTDQGVIVFAQSNEETDTSASVMAALPEIYPELQGSWAVAVNGLPEYDANGNISEVHRLSASCLETAQYCLTANGTTYGGTSVSDSSYGMWTGTSFAAPQISGSVALLAEAFPSLPASDLLDRLFASANNSFLTPTGEVDFGNGVTHGYDEEFGHGFVDLKAALQPIGDVGVPVSNSAYDGVAPLSEVSVTAGSAHGDAIASALNNKTMAIYDSLGADFTVEATAIVEEQDENAEMRLASFRSDVESTTSAAASYSFLEDGLSSDTGGFEFVSGTTSDLAENLGFFKSGGGLFTGQSSIIADSPETMAFATLNKADGQGFGVMTFVERSTDGIKSAGFGFSAAKTIAPGFTGVFGLVANGETGSALGLTVESQDDETVSAASSAFSLAGEWTYQQGLSFFANAEFGMTAASGAGYMQSFTPALHSAFTAGLKMDGVFANSDRITLSLRQPLRIEQGTGTMRLPSGRLEDGTITYQSHQVGLTPSARQLDFGFRYDVGLQKATKLGFGGVLSVNEGHTQGELGASAMMAFKHHF